MNGMCVPSVFGPSLVHFSSGSSSFAVRTKVGGGVHFVQLTLAMVVPAWFARLAVRRRRAFAVPRCGLFPSPSPICYSSTSRFFLTVRFFSFLPRSRQSPVTSIFCLPLLRYLHCTLLLLALLLFILHPTTTTFLSQVLKPTCVLLSLLYYGFPPTLIAGAVNREPSDSLPLVLLYFVFTQSSHSAPH